MGRNPGVQPSTTDVHLGGVRHHHLEGNQAAPDWSDGNVCDGIALFRSDGNRLVLNTVANDNPDGIHVSEDSDGNVVRGNRAFQNVGDGIEVDNRLTTIGGNRAERNGGWGIDAVRGVTDAGGNTAADNVDPAQCRNVVCG